MEDKLDMQSPDLVNANFEKLAALFPNCVTESEQGKAIDFDLLRQELSHQVVEGTKERYRLEWPGKREAIVTANLPTTKTLRPVREDSVDFDTTENLYIEGDNLEVLKLLQESYLGKIKMIYIDPPYNTGKDFVYKDNFSKDAQAELIESGQKDEYNRRLVANPESSGRYHSDWLSMMYPRLKLARNLLTDDGLIFMTIDDNEIDNLKKLSIEIFGENNFVGCIVWNSTKSVTNTALISVSHNYNLIFAKDVSFFVKNRSGFRLPELGEGFSNPDNDPRGPWKADPFQVGGWRPNQQYEIINPNTGEVYSPNEGCSWKNDYKKYQELLRENRIVFGVSGEAGPQRKRFLSEALDRGKVPKTWWDDVGATTNGTRTIKKLFDGNPVFTNPKPVDLIERMIQLGDHTKEGIILDFFGGSSTTSHAVFKNNFTNKSKNKFIIVQLDEVVDEKSIAGKLGYQSITEIGKERIRRAAQKIKTETGADIDYGFRVYRLDSSNMQEVYYKPQDYAQGSLDMFADNIKPDRTGDDLLAQVMLDWGLPLSLPIEQETVAGKQVFKVAGDSLYACFDSGIDEDFAKAIAEDAPLRIVFRDSGFRNDTAKVNVRQLLKQLSPDTEMKVI